MKANVAESVGRSDLSKFSFMCKISYSILVSIIMLSILL